MPGRVIWHDRAEKDIAEAYLFIGADSPAAAERLLDAVQSAVQLLRENHGAGRLREFRSLRARGVRSWVVKEFQSYLIFYRAADADLEVVRFIHGGREFPKLLEGET